MLMFRQILVCAVSALAPVRASSGMARTVSDAVIGGILVMVASPMANAFFSSSWPLGNSGLLRSPSVTGDVSNSVPAFLTEGREGPMQSVPIIVGTDEELERILIQYPQLRGAVHSEALSAPQSRNPILSLLSGGAQSTPAFGLRQNIDSVFRRHPFLASPFGTKVLPSSGFGMPHQDRQENSFTQGPVGFETFPANAAPSYAVPVRRPPPRGYGQAPQRVYALPAPLEPERPRRYGQPPKRGYVQPPPPEPEQPTGYGQPPQRGYAQPAPPEPEQPTGYGQPPRRGYAQPPPPEPEQPTGYGQAPQRGYAQPAPPAPEQPTGYGQPPRRGYAQPPPPEPEQPTGYGQAPQRGYTQPPPPAPEQPTGYGQPPKRGYAQPPPPEPVQPTGYGQVPQRGYAQPPARGYAQPQPPLPEPEQPRAYGPSQPLFSQPKQPTTGYGQPSRPMTQPTYGRSVPPAPLSLQVFDSSANLHQTATVTGDQSITSPPQDASFDAGAVGELPNFESSLTTQEESHILNSQTSSTNEKHSSSTSDNNLSLASSVPAGDHIFPSSASSSNFSSSSASSSSSSSSSISSSSSSSVVSSSGSAVPADVIQKATSGVTAESNGVNSVLDNVEHDHSMNSVQNNADYFQGQLPAEPPVTAGSVWEATGTVPGIVEQHQQVQQSASVEGSPFHGHVGAEVPVTVDHFAKPLASTHGMAAVQTIQSTSDNAMPVHLNVNVANPIVSDNVIRPVQGNAPHFPAQTSVLTAAPAQIGQTVQFVQGHNFPAVNAANEVSVQGDAQYADVHHEPAPFTSHVMQEASGLSDIRASVPVHPSVNMANPIVSDNVIRPVQGNAPHIPAQTSVLTTAPAQMDQSIQFAQGHNFPAFSVPNEAFVQGDANVHREPTQFTPHVVQEASVQTVPSWNHIPPIALQPAKPIVSDNVIRPIQGSGSHLPVQNLGQVQMTHSLPAAIVEHSLPTPSEQLQEPSHTTVFTDSAGPSPLVSQTPEVLSAQFIKQVAPFDTNSGIVQEASGSTPVSNQITASVPVHLSVNMANPIVSDNVIRPAQRHVPHVSAQPAVLISAPTQVDESVQFVQGHNFPAVSVANDASVQGGAQSANVHREPARFIPHVVQEASVQAVPSSNHVPPVKLHPATPIVSDNVIRPVQANAPHFPAQIDQSVRLDQSHNYPAVSVGNEAFVQGDAQFVKVHGEPARVTPHVMQEAFVQTVQSPNHIPPVAIHPATLIVSDNVIRPVQGSGSHLPGHNFGQIPITHSLPAAIIDHSLPTSSEQLQEPSHTGSFAESSALPLPAREAPQVVSAQFTKQVEPFDTHSGIAQEANESTPVSNEIRASAPEHQQHNGISALLTTSDNVIRPASRLQVLPEIRSRSRREATSPDVDVSADSGFEEAADEDDYVDEDEANAELESLESSVLEGPAAIEEYFSFLQTSDHDNCLKRLVCEMSQDPESYGLVGRQMREFFLNYEPINIDDPSNTYRAAATIGHANDTACLTAYPTCTVTSEEMREQTLAAVAPNQPEEANGDVQ